VGHVNLPKVLLRYDGTMDRVIVISPEELERSRSLTVDQRLRQANAALRLYTALHGVPKVDKRPIAHSTAGSGHAESPNRTEPR